MRNLHETFAYSDSNAVKHCTQETVEELSEIKMCSKKKKTKTRD